MMVTIHRSSGPFGPSVTYEYANRREMVRHMATTMPAFRLSREMRCEAASDPALEWDPNKGRYRRRRKPKAGAGNVYQSVDEDRRRVTRKNPKSDF